MRWKIGTVLLWVDWVLDWYPLSRHTGYRCRAGEIDQWMEGR